MQKVRNVISNRAQVQGECLEQVLMQIFVQSGHEVGLCFVQELTQGFELGDAEGEGESDAGGEAIAKMGMHVGDGRGWEGGISHGLGGCAVEKMRI